VKKRESKEERVKTFFFPFPFFFKQKNLLKNDNTFHQRKETLSPLFSQATFFEEEETPPLPLPPLRLAAALALSAPWPVATVAAPTASSLGRNSRTVSLAQKRT
jgi:hypothetical protein